MIINYLDILIEYKKLTLPSVGSFSVLFHSAKIDKEEYLIYPPFKQVVYDQKSLENEYSKEIASYLEMKMGLPRVEAIEISKKESLAFSDKKSNASIIPIAGLGRLFKGKQGEWMFAPDDIEIFREERRGFPIITYTPLSISTVAAIEDPIETNELDISEPIPVHTPKEVNKSKRGAFAWWPFSLAAVVLLVSFFLWQQQKSKDTSFKVFKMASPEARLNVKPLENDRLYPENIEELDGTMIDSSRFYEGEEAKEDLEELKESQNNTSKDKIIPDEYKKNEEDKAISDIKISDIPGSNPALGPGDCLVIVGAFANPENVEKMKEKLAEYGASIVTDTDVKLTRVGVMIPCNSADLPQLLNRLRSEVNTASWVMRQK